LQILIISPTTSDMG